MERSEAIKARHSVRRYKDQPIEKGVLALLRQEIDACNRESGLHVQMVVDEPKAFSGLMPHYGKFSGVKNYIAMVGPADSAEKVGYYGERLVLKAQTLGLNTCWVALSFGKRAAKQNCTRLAGEKLHCVISVGYGETQGVPHKSKEASALCRCEGEVPDWFRAGVEAAMLAPTAVNQQKFLLSLNGRTVTARNLGGFYSDIDLGIVKYHFEAVAGKEKFEWAPSQK